MNEGLSACVDECSSPQQKIELSIATRLVRSMCRYKARQLLVKMCSEGEYSVGQDRLVSRRQAVEGWLRAWSEAFNRWSTLLARGPRETHGVL